MLRAISYPTSSWSPTSLPFNHRSFEFLHATVLWWICFSCNIDFLFDFSMFTKNFKIFSKIHGFSSFRVKVFNVLITFIMSKHTTRTKFFKNPLCQKYQYPLNNLLKIMELGTSHQVDFSHQVSYFYSFHYIKLTPLSKIDWPIFEIFIKIFKFLIF